MSGCLRVIRSRGRCGIVSGEMEQESEDGGVDLVSDEVFRWTAEKRTFTGQMDVDGERERPEGMLAKRRSRTRKGRIDFPVVRYARFVS